MTVFIYNVWNRNCGKTVDRWLLRTEEHQGCGITAEGCAALLKCGL